MLNNGKKKTLCCSSELILHTRWPFPLELSNLAALLRERKDTSSISVSLYIAESQYLRNTVNMNIKKKVMSKMCRITTCSMDLEELERTFEERDERRYRKQGIDTGVCEGGNSLYSGCLQPDPHDPHLLRVMSYASASSCLLVGHKDSL